jgi:hypothetical protein
MNIYAYCGNNPLNGTDPSGLALWEGRFQFISKDSPYYLGGVTIECWSDPVEGSGVGPGKLEWRQSYDSLDQFYDLMQDQLGLEWMSAQPGWKLSGGNTEIFWAVKTLEWMNVITGETISNLENTGWSILYIDRALPAFGNSCNGYIGKDIYWNPDENYFTPPGCAPKHWNRFPPLAGLAHELGHAIEIFEFGTSPDEQRAIRTENSARSMFYYCIPGYENIWPRPLTGNDDLAWTVEGAWKRYRRLALLPIIR